MKINWNWDAQVRPFYRIMAGILGVFSIYGSLFMMHYKLNENFRGPIAGLLAGIFLIVVCIRGKWFGK